LRSPIEGIAPSALDDLVLAPGLQAKLLIETGATLHEGRDSLQSEAFGCSPDYLVFLPDLENPLRAILWVNHEFPESVVLHGVVDPLLKSLPQVELERRMVGGSILTLRREQVDADWTVDFSSSLNRRLDGYTEIPFRNFRPFPATSVAVGTFGNCAGGVTPWGTILTCEENYQDYVGEVSLPGRERVVRMGSFHYGWHRYFELPPENYGWVVEVDPHTGRAEKLNSLGRFSHESATVVSLPDGRVVVYSGDDKRDSFLFKWIGTQPSSLSEGVLYAASLEKGEWLKLDRDHPTLRGKFRTQAEVLTFAREAARLRGATPLDRPEDVEWDGSTGSAFVALTNNYQKENFFGSILKVKEEGGSPESLRFHAETYLAGGLQDGFACPDNLVFDPRGNLWFTTDMSDSRMGKPPYTEFGNNGLFLVPRSGPDAGRVIRVASAPRDAELTGPYFSSDGRTLFLSVQHPGEGSPAPGEWTSHWPRGGQEAPRSAVVQIRGELLELVSRVSY
jgi:secreted PhoX family phosphatase